MKYDYGIEHFHDQKLQNYIIDDHENHIHFLLLKILISFNSFNMNVVTLFLTSLFKISASRIAFVMMTVALCIFTYMKIVDSKDFMMLCSAVFSYYFGRGQSQPTIENPQGKSNE